MAEEMIGTQIRKLRGKFGWSQPQLADKMNVSRQTISNWENGIKSPRMGALQRLSDLFNVTIGYITDGDDKNPNNIEQKDIEAMIKNDDYMTFGGRPLTDEEKKLLTKLLRDD